MAKDAVFLGSISVVAETSEMQRRAFNAAFAEAGLDWSWEGAEYRALLRKPGGRQRIADYAAARGDGVDAEAVHRRKSEIFQQLMTEEGLVLRPGVEDLVAQARAGRLRLAWVTATSRANVDAYLDGLGDALDADDFELITDASMIARGKPDPQVYQIALDRLALSADSVVAVEDTPECLAAATGAGIDCFAFPNAVNDDVEFPGARRVLDRLTPEALGL